MKYRSRYRSWCNWSWSSSANGGCPAPHSVLITVGSDVDKFLMDRRYLHHIRFCEQTNSMINPPAACHIPFRSDRITTSQVHVAKPVDPNDLITVAASLTGRRGTE